MGKITVYSFAFTEGFVSIKWHSLRTNSCLCKRCYSLLLPTQREEFVGKDSALHFPTQREGFVGKDVALHFPTQRDGFVGKDIALHFPTQREGFQVGRI